MAADRPTNVVVAVARALKAVIADQILTGRAAQSHVDAIHGVVSCLELLVSICLTSYNFHSLLCIMQQHSQRYTPHVSLSRSYGTIIPVCTVQKRLAGLVAAAESRRLQDWMR